MLGDGLSKKSANYNIVDLFINLLERRLKQLARSGVLNDRVKPENFTPSIQEYWIMSAHSTKVRVDEKGRNLPRGQTRRKAIFCPQPWDL